MKTASAPTPESTNEQLNYLTEDQIAKLKKIGFDWHCSNIELTVPLGLKFLRKRFGVSHTIYSRSWSQGIFGYSVSHSFLYLDLIDGDLQEKGDDNEDGIVSFDYDKAESIALDYALRYMLRNFERDFSWLQPNEKAFKSKYESNVDEVVVLEVNDKVKVAKIAKDNFMYYISFHKLFQTAKEALSEKN